MKNSAVIIFIKEPDLNGDQPTSNDQAIKVHRQMLQHTQLITKALSTDKFLYYNGTVKKNDTWPNDIYIKKKQTGSDVSNRMANAFKDVFKLGHQHIIVIGCDRSELDERIIRMAFRQLEHFDTVLGPTKDGGFYLLGMNQLHPEIFKVQGWGTPELAKGIFKIIQHLNKSCFMLPELAGMVTMTNQDNYKVINQTNNTNN